MAPNVRQILLAGICVSYSLSRGRRRSIVMQVDSRGLTVRAPVWTRLAEIEEALIERARWIVRKLHEWTCATDRTLPRAWQSGESIWLMGRTLSLSLHRAPRALVRCDLFHLQVFHQRPGDGEAIAELVHAWLYQQALDYLQRAAARFAARLALAPPMIKLSNARTQWGSCNRRGQIRLHWRLIQLAPPLADYVVAHEVAHLIELNHSPRFWALVERLYPDHSRAKDELDAMVPLLGE